MIEVDMQPFCRSEVRQPSLQPLFHRQSLRNQAKFFVAIVQLAGGYGSGDQAMGKCPPQQFGGNK